jgi:hypothetical protein
MYICLHVKYPLCLPDSNETLTFSTELKKYSNVKFHENPFSGSRVIPGGRTDEHDEINNRISQFCEIHLKSYILPLRGQIILILYGCRKSGLDLP